MAECPETRRVVRVFVSSPGDVTEERAVLDEVVAACNRSEGPAHGVYVELFKWEDDVVPRIGRKPQREVDAQTPQYDVYLGIMSARFGGGGTRKEFRDALKKWKDTGRTWVVFYFDDAAKTSREPKEVEQYLKVCRFRRDLESKGIVGSYVGVRGSQDSFFEKVSSHLRKIIHEIQPPRAPVTDGPERPRLSDPNTYLRDLYAKTAFIDIRGLQVGKGRAHRFPIEELFISLTTSHVPERPKDGSRRRRASARRANDSDADSASPGIPRALPLQVHFGTADW